MNQTAQTTKRSSQKVVAAGQKWLKDNVELFPNGYSLTTQDLKSLLLNAEVITVEELMTSTMGTILNNCVTAGWMTRRGGSPLHPNVSKEESTRLITFTVQRPVEQPQVAIQTPLPLEVEALDQTRLNQTFLDCLFNLHTKVDLLLKHLNLNIPEAPPIQDRAMKLFLRRDEALKVTAKKK